MEPVSVILIAAFSLVGALYQWRERVHLRREAELTRAWGEAGRRLGLEQIGPRALHGQVGGLTVSAHTRLVSGARGARRGGTSITVEGLSTRDVELHPRAALEAADDEGTPALPELGREVLVRGPAIVVRALLDGGPDAGQATWQMVRDALAAGWSFSAWAWRLEREVVDQGLVALVEQGLDLARRLEAAEGERLARLARLATADPAPAVRVAALEHLRRHHKRAPETRAALERAHSDLAPEVRYFVALMTKDLALVAGVASDPAATSALRLEALAALDQVPRLGRRCADLVPAMHASWGATGAEVRGACLELARTHRLPGAVGLARAVLTSEAGRDQGQEVDEVGLAAVRVLAELGAIEDVPVLLALGERRAGLERASREAVLTIQGRASGARAGALALVEGGGGLALAPVARTEAEGRSGASPRGTSRNEQAGR